MAGPARIGKAPPLRRGPGGKQSAGDGGHAAYRLENEPARRRECRRSSAGLQEHSTTKLAVVFGSPTNMGNVFWQYKRLADASPKPWYGRAWKDKLAAGVTHSASINGDKGSAIAWLVTLGMQHGMLWVGTGMLPSDARRQGGTT